MQVPVQPSPQVNAVPSVVTGSEPGVLNLTWLLQKKDGTWWILTVSDNDPAKDVPTAGIEVLAQRIMALP